MMMILGVVVGVSTRRNHHRTLISHLTYAMLRHYCLQLEREEHKKFGPAQLIEFGQMNQ